MRNNAHVDQLFDDPIEHRNNEILHTVTFDLLLTSICRKQQNNQKYTIFYVIT